MNTVEQRILVVDDIAITRERFAEVLRREGFEVVVAGNGQEALDYLRNGVAPDLIVLDMLMPILDGWHFLERLAFELPQVQSDIPIIVTTASVLTRRWAEDHGCRGFLRKPVDPAAVVEEVRRCLG